MGFLYLITGSSSSSFSYSSTTVPRVTPHQLWLSAADDDSLFVQSPQRRCPLIGGRHLEGHNIDDQEQPSITGSSTAPAAAAASINDHSRPIDHLEDSLRVFIIVFNLFCVFNSKCIYQILSVIVNVFNYLPRALFVCHFFQIGRFM